MKIELKPEDFKLLYEICDNNLVLELGFDKEIRRIIDQELKPQYDKAFLKYQKEKQKFKVGERVKFRWFNGEIVKVQRRQDGKYLYTVQYGYLDGDIWIHSRRVLTGKNLETLEQL